MILNERILQLVVTLSEELHFGRAAARLHLSQPALSGTVKTLERDLGVRLFGRTSRRVELTVAGQVFAAEARRLIKEGERAVALVKESSSDTAGPLHVGYPQSMNFRWLGSLISRARSDTRLAPELQFVSSEADRLDEQITQRNLQAAFFAGPTQNPELGSVQLFREPFSVVLAAGHPMAKRKQLGFEQLSGEPVVWIRRNVEPMLYDKFMELYSAQSYHPNVTQEVGSLYECLQFARAGLGITFLPRFMKMRDEDGSVVFIRLPENTLYVDYSLAYLKNGGVQGIDRFIQLVRNHASEETKDV